MRRSSRRTELGKASCRQLLLFMLELGKEVTSHPRAEVTSFKFVDCTCDGALEGKDWAAALFLGPGPGHTVLIF